MTKLIHQELSSQLIGAYYMVYNRLGSTYPEHIFEKAMLVVLKRAGVECVRQDEYQIFYKDRLVGVQRLDIFASGKAVVELKVAPRIEPVHLAQLLSYMKTVSAEVGLLFRFGGPAPEFVRRVLTPQAWTESISVATMSDQDLSGFLFPDVTSELLAGAIEVFRTLGPGFIHRIYANACFHEFRLRGLEVLPRNEFHVFLDAEDLGAIKFNHLQIDNRVLVFPVAVSDPHQLHISNLKAWMRHLNVPLGIVFNFRATHFEPVVLRV